MRRKYRSMSDRYPNFIICTVNNWMNLFTQNLYRNTVIDCLEEYREQKDLQIFAYCIMTNQIHLVLSTESEEMGSICSELKHDITPRLVKKIKENPQQTRSNWLLPALNHRDSDSDTENDFQLWEDHFHPIPLTSRQLADQKMEYLHRQPVRAGYVQKPEDYLYSSARNYAGKEAVLDIDTDDIEAIFSNAPD